MRFRKRLLKFRIWIDEHKTMMVCIAILVFLLFLSSGGLYVITEERHIWAVPIVTALGTVYRFYWPGSLMLQTPSELIVTFVAYLGAFAGLYITYRGLRRTYREEVAPIMTILGVLLVIVSIIVLYILVYSKVTS